MVAHLLWILAVYGAAVILVHVLHARRERRSESSKHLKLHYVLVMSNHERQVEWYLRALSLYALLSGTRVRVTVLDDGSEDQTMQIVERLSGLSGIELSYGDWTEYDGAGTEREFGRVEEKEIFIDLRKPREAAQIPYVQG